mmetsp:Transcript_13619/g.23947  ORF Transcript_13619/g.23947 Transcript_13619/m.23947 type:complete len:99 (+) Transcript_13619:1757-2053(+)
MKAIFDGSAVPEFVKEVNCTRRCWQIEVSVLSEIQALIRIQAACQCCQDSGSYPTMLRAQTVFEMCEGTRDDMWWEVKQYDEGTQYAETSGGLLRRER